jgi:hypothetical protein
MLPARPVSTALLLLAAASGCGRDTRAPRAGDGGRPPAAARAASTVVPVAAARRLADGAAAEVEGVVTVASGIMDAGFALQDASGGIYVAADSSVAVSFGQRLRVTGRLGDHHGLRVLIPGQVRPLGVDTLPSPRPLATGAVGEANEGWLVQVSGRVLAPPEEDAPYGWKLRVDDGSGPLQLFLPAGGGEFWPRRWTTGSRIRATGLSAQYDQVYEVIPATAQDLWPPP